MNFKVWFNSIPSPGSEYYDGYIDVFADDEEEAIDRAFHKLKGNFPERNRSSWKVEKIEYLGN